MQKFDVVIALEGLREAREAWGKARTEFFAGYDVVQRRLLHEAARAYMSPVEVGHALGVSAGTVRKAMRKAGLDPKSGKRTLGESASKALVGNSELLGIEPHQMDLTSPLAYLPMGKDLKRRLEEQTVSGVTEFPETPEEAYRRGYEDRAAERDFNPSVLA